MKRWGLILLAGLFLVLNMLVVPGCNDSVENIRRSARFAVESGFKQIELIPYHRLGVSKYSQYGMVYPLDEAGPASQTDMQDLRDVVERFGLKEMTGKI